MPGAGAVSGKMSTGGLATGLACGNLAALADMCGAGPMIGCPRRGKQKRDWGCCKSLAAVASTS
jgi:hypothetical protein